MHGIKKKKLRWYKTPKESDLKQERQKLGTMKMLLTKAKKQGYRIVYIDETVVTRKAVPLTEWTRKKENMSVDVTKIDEPTLALLSAISKEKGQEHYQIFEQSVNIDKFLEWLAGMKAASGEAKICLFMDNLGVHTSKRAKDEMRKYGFRFIYNLPYRPE